MDRIVDRYRLSVLVVLLSLAAMPSTAGIVERLGLQADLLTDEHIDFSAASPDGDHAEWLTLEQAALLALPLDSVEEFPVAVVGCRPVAEGVDLLLLQQQCASGASAWLATYTAAAERCDWMCLGVASGVNTAYSMPALYAADDPEPVAPPCAAVEATILRTDVAGQFDLLRTLRFAPVGVREAEPLWQMHSFESFAVGTDGRISLTERQLRCMPAYDASDDRQWQRRAEMLGALPASDTTAIAALDELCAEAAVSYAEMSASCAATDVADPVGALPESAAALRERAALLSAVTAAAALRRTARPDEARHWRDEHPDSPLALVFANQ